ncbi:deoxyhypusine synthase family protein [Candidatus Uhrbacteria bacterium]|nr:deoxyhypusine synthase family protein [Candidatus Uhrbacteria bacterium]
MHDPHAGDLERHAAGSGHNDNFVPLENLDISKIHTCDDLLLAMEKTSFGGRKVGEAADLLYTMVTDPDCFVVGTFSGAMTVAKQGLLIADMIDRGMINAIVSTGALMTHGLVDAGGMLHFKFDFDRMNDSALFKRGYDRVYDTLELEKNLDDLEELVTKVFDGIDPQTVCSSRHITECIGTYLSEHVQGRGIVISAVKKGVPIYIPAFTDSELGLDFALYNRRQRLLGKPELSFSPFLDLEHYTEMIAKQKRIGIFTIGGGVPRNWAQQVACYLDLVNFRIFERYNVDERMDVKRFHYGIRICPEPVHWGGLSGCTYSEGVSWGKFVPPEEGGKFVEVLADATTVWPLIVKGVCERLDKKQKVL